jgi:hypothetical protein
MTGTKLTWLGVVSAAFGEPCAVQVGLPGSASPAIPRPPARRRSDPNPAGNIHALRKLSPVFGAAQKIYGLGTDNKIALLLGVPP